MTASLRRTDLFFRLWVETVTSTTYLTNKLEEGSLSCPRDTYDSHPPEEILNSSIAFHAIAACMP
jgi:hypothetical protein